MVTQAKRVMVVALAALAVLGAADAARAGGGVGSIDPGGGGTAQERERPGEEIPSEQGGGTASEGGVED
jgi:hypothetical protein